MRTVDLAGVSLTPALAAGIFTTDFTVLLAAGRDAVPEDFAVTVPVPAVLAAAATDFVVAKLPPFDTVFFADTDFTADLAGDFFIVVFATGFLAVSFGAGLAAALVGWACGLVFLAATLVAGVMLLRDLAVFTAVLAGTGLPALRTAGLALLAAAGLLGFLALVAATLFFVVFLVTVAFIALILKELPDAYDH